MPNIPQFIRIPCFSHKSKPFLAKNVFVLRPKDIVLLLPINFCICGLVSRHIRFYPFALRGFLFLSPTKPPITIHLQTQIPRQDAGVIWRIFFSTCFLGIIIWCPQPIHFSLKSAPILKTSHSKLPQGCFFFNFTTSPTWISIRLSQFLSFFLFRVVYH